jgi:hypothetical protein
MEERVLLRLIEAVNFIDKENRSPAKFPFVASLGDCLAQILHSRKDGREADELCVCRGRQKPSQGGLTGAWRAPQD